MNVDELLQKLRDLVPPSPNSAGDEAEAGNFRCEGCRGCRSCKFCRDCVDCSACTYCEECERCHDCTRCRRSEALAACNHVDDSLRCSDSSYLRLCIDCVDCLHCLACVGLSGAEFHILNEKVSQKEYFATLSQLKAELKARVEAGFRFEPWWQESKIGHRQKPSPIQPEPSYEGSPARLERLGRGIAEDFGSELRAEALMQRSRQDFRSRLQALVKPPPAPKRYFPAEPLERWSEKTPEAPPEMPSSSPSSKGADASAASPLESRIEGSSHVDSLDSLPALGSGQLSQPRATFEDREIFEGDPGEQTFPELQSPPIPRWERRLEAHEVERSKEHSARDAAASPRPSDLFSKDLRSAERKPPNRSGEQFRVTGPPEGRVGEQFRVTDRPEGRVPGQSGFVPDRPEGRVPGQSGFIDLPEGRVPGPPEGRVPGQSGFPDLPEGRVPGPPEGRVPGQSGFPDLPEGRVFDPPNPSEKPASSFGMPADPPGMASPDESSSPARAPARAPAPATSRRSPAGRRPADSSSGSEAALSPPPPPGGNRLLEFVKSGARNPQEPTPVEVGRWVRGKLPPR